MKKIVVIEGGTSAEREISLKSARAIKNALSQKGFEVQSFDPKENTVSSLIAMAPDAAFNALHGKNGEDGVIQGLLESLKIPYTGSNVAVSALCFDKILTKSYLKNFDIVTPRFLHWQQDETLDFDKLSFPVIVKPSREGSTFGVTIVKSPKEIKGALETALKFCHDILIEEFVSGTEITVGLLDGKALPIVEIVPESGFFDFESKYTKGKTKYYVPARLGEAVSQKCQRISEKIASLLSCTGAPRADFILDKKGEPWFLEINTIPGMTETSLLPQAAKALGIDFPELCGRILKTAKLYGSENAFLEPK